MSHTLPPHASTEHHWVIAGHWDPGPHAYIAQLPPRLADFSPLLSRELEQRCRQAALAAALLDHGSARHVRGVAATLIQAESIASCLLDGHNAPPQALAMAEAGQPTTAAARAVTKAAGSLAAHLENAGRAISLGAIASAHTRPRRMASGSAKSQPYRTKQTWLAGTDLWPRGADFVPPHPAHIAELMEDLVIFCGRDDVDPVAQAAIAHAQLLSIQPFATDNARTARAVINGVLRRRAVTQVLAVPVSASLASEASKHSRAWAAYRAGDPAPIITLVATHIERSCAPATATADAIAALPAAWNRAARPRAASATAKLIPHLTSSPLVNADVVRRLTGASQASAYEAIARLAEADVLTRISPTRRETMWAALDVFDAAAALAEALGRQGRPSLQPPSSPRRPSGTSAAA